MQRIPEPELMNDPVQAAAYAAADFTEPHTLFVENFRETFPSADIITKVLDLGCGPADVTVRFARAYPRCVIHGVDGSEVMLREGKTRLKREGLENRISLFPGVIPEIVMPEKHYNVIISNSLLHHLHEPALLWECIKKISMRGTLVYVMDLIRPDNRRQAAQLVSTYAGAEPLILKRDFFNSLCAAFRPEEVVLQLQAAGLDELRIKTISDRHMVIHGRITNDQI
jgi:trans-aconitate methyltransferase